jgi:RNA polymerase sigma factor (TIGR02999 family)
LAKLTKRGGLAFVNTSSNQSSGRHLNRWTRRWAVDTKQDSLSACRRILTDYVRARQYAKRGGGAQVVSLDAAPEVSPKPRADLVALDDALKRLAAVDERKSRVVELRYFGGLSVEETGEVLKVSPETVMRDWKLARAWLLRELSGEQGDES